MEGAKITGIFHDYLNNDKLSKRYNESGRHISTHMNKEFFSLLSMFILLKFANSHEYS
jgi:hypothetical protein